MMLMPCGPSAVPTGGAGVACPAGIWILTVAASLFFAISIRSLSSASGCSSFQLPFLQLRDLAELELDGRLPTEDVHEHRELRAGDVDVGDRAVEVGERARDHTHLLALLELEPRPHLLLHARLFLADTEHVLDFLARQRCGPCAVTDEAGD